MNGSQDDDIRNMICNIISKNPGIFISKIAELLEMKVTIIQDHLVFLEKNQRIISVEQEGYKRYYVKESHLGILDQRMAKTRKRLYTLIANNPGLHLSKISQLLNMRISLTEYHLQNMEREHIVTSVKDVGYYKRYYITDSIAGIQERIIVSLLREELPLKIILFLLRYPSAQHKDILKNLPITSSTLSYHLNKLVRHGIIEILSEIDEKGYAIRNKNEIFTLLKKYQLIPITKSFSDIWDSLKFK